MTQQYILTIKCPEKMGIVRAVSNCLYDLGCSVFEAGEYADLDKQIFFARWAFGSAGDEQLPSIEEFKRIFEPIAEAFAMTWQVADSQQKPKLLIAVSQHGHCLNDLLYRWKEEDFPGDIVGVVSNHETFRSQVEWYGLPFFYLPITPETKTDQESQLMRIMNNLDVDLLVLARYMQILSDSMCEKVQGRAINIHHSFLPSFKGAKPYHQAYARGVKISGATAHYVTADLDEGPIIEQDVQRVEQHDTPDRLARIGKNIERVVLSRAVFWHCQHRIIIDGNRTIIFK